MEPDFDGDLLGSPPPTPKRPSGGLNSNAVKFGLAGVLLLIVLMIFIYQLNNRTNKLGMGGAQNAVVNVPPAPTTDTSDSSSATTASENGGTTSDTTSAATADTSSAVTPNITNDTPPTPTLTTTQDTSPPPTPQNQTSPGQMPNLTTNQSSPGQPMPNLTSGPTLKTVPAPEAVSTDFKSWKKADYLRAKQQNDARLVEAIHYWGKNSEGDNDAASDIAEIIKSDQPAGTANAMYGGSNRASPQVIEAVIAALTDNGSDKAWEIIRKIIKGEYFTDDDRTSLEWAIKTLVAHYKPQNEELIKLMVIDPETVRQGPEGNARLQDTIKGNFVDAVRLKADPKTLERIAVYLVENGNLQMSDAITSVFLNESEEYIAGQRFLYKSNELTQELNARFEQIFVDYATFAIATTLGAPPVSESLMGRSTSSGYQALNSQGGLMYGSDASSKEKKTDSEKGLDIAGTLWGESFADLVNDRLINIRYWEKEGQILCLGSALPVDSTRAALYSIMKKKALDGPQPFISIGIPDRYMSDPGFLVLLKMLPRKDLNPIKSLSKPTAPMTRTRTGGGPDLSAGATSSKSESQQKKEQTEVAWMNFSSKVVTTLCDRLDAMSLWQKKNWRRGNKIGEPPPTQSDDIGELPIPKDSRNLVSYQLNWPQNAPAELSPLRPGYLKIQFFRFEWNTTPKKAVAALKKNLKSVEMHDLDRDGIWIESLKTDKPSDKDKSGKPATKRSIDIVVRNTDKTPIDFSQKEEEGDLDIDILAIEILDPTATKD